MMGWTGRKTSPGVRPKIQKQVADPSSAVRAWEDEDGYRAYNPPSQTEVSAPQTPISLSLLVEDCADDTEEKGFSGSACWSQRWSLSFIEMDKTSRLPWLSLFMKPAEDVLFINIEQEGRQQFWNPSTIVTCKMWEGIKKKKIIARKSHIIKKKEKGNIDLARPNPHVNSWRQLEKYLNNRSSKE